MLDILAAAGRAMDPAWLLTGALALIIVSWVLYTIMRRKLLREKERAEITLHSISYGVIRTDAGGRVDYMNPVAEQYTGWSNAEAHGQLLDVVYQIVEEQTGKPLAAPETTGHRVMAGRLIG